MASQRQQLEHLKELRAQNKSSQKTKEQLDQSIIDRKKRWITFFRHNINLYIHYRMKFYMFPYQHYSLYDMGTCDTYFDVSTRGVSKTMKAVTYGVAHALLFPYSKIGVAAVTRSQADEDFESTFKGDVLKNSALVNWLWDNGYITAKESEKGYVLRFWNGSVIYFFPAIDSSRGLHLDVLILEECRLIKKSAVDSICKPMLVLRQPQYKKHHEYLTYRSPFDKMQTIYITSNRFKDEWFNTTFNQTFVDYFKDKLNTNLIFCSDIFLAIKHGLRTMEWFKRTEKEMSELDFRMEVLNETVGSVEGAFFTWEQFRKNQIIKKAFIPPTNEEFHNGTVKNRKKSKNEYRFIFIDFSFAGSHGGTINDNTVIGCASLQMKDNKLYRNVEYIETFNGSDNFTTLIRIREIFYDYQADYIIFDAANGGRLNYDSLSMPYEHPYRNPTEWNPHGFTLANEMYLQMVSASAYDELKSRTIDPQAIPCLIPILANNQWNSEMWQSLALRLKNNEISFLVDESEYETDLYETSDWIKMDNEEKARRKLPYIYTRLMIHEACSLKQEWRAGLLYLRENGRATKDSIVALAYLNAIADKFETYLNQKEQTQEVDWSNYTFIV